jgi:hypothetical protein
MAGGVIAMRKMKEMHSMVVSTYVNFFLALFSIVWVYFSPNMNFQFIKELTINGWLLFGVVGLLSISE